jgi:hypothetical protein
MESFLFRILESEAGSFGFIVAIIITIVWVIYHVTKFTTRISTEHGSFCKRMDGLEDNIYKMKEDMVLVKGSVELIQKSLQNNNFIVNSYAQQHSPVRVTKEGHEMIKRTGLDHAIDKSWTNTRAYLNDHLKTKNPYDIQQFIIEQVTIYPEKFIGNEDLDKLKLLAYKEGLPINAYLTVVSILIRDKYFIETGIDVNDVDKFAQESSSARNP